MPSSINQTAAPPSFVSISITNLILKISKEFGSDTTHRPPATIACGGVTAALRRGAAPEFMLHCQTFPAK